MKKLREWFKVRRNGYIVIQTSNVLVIALCIFNVARDPYSAGTIINAALAGFCSAMVISNYFLERIHGSNARLIGIVEEQQALLKEIMDQKAGEIAGEIASRMGGNVSVSVDDPDGPINPSPTKH